MTLLEVKTTDQHSNIYIALNAIRDNIYIAPNNNIVKEYIANSAFSHHILSPISQIRGGRTWLVGSKRAFGAESLHYKAAIRELGGETVRQAPWESKAE